MVGSDFFRSFARQSARRSKRRGACQGARDLCAAKYGAAHQERHAHPATATRSTRHRQRKCCVHPVSRHNYRGTPTTTPHSCEITEGSKADPKRGSNGANHTLSCAESTSTGETKEANEPKLFHTITRLCLCARVAPGASSRFPRRRTKATQDNIWRSTLPWADSCLLRNSKLSRHGSVEVGLSRIIGQILAEISEAWPNSAPSRSRAPWSTPRPNLAELGQNFPPK